MLQGVDSQGCFTQPCAIWPPARCFLPRREFVPPDSSQLAPWGGDYLYPRAAFALAEDRRYGRIAHNSLVASTHIASAGNGRSN